MNLSNQKRVLFIGLVWPEPTSSAAGYRIIQLVDAFLAKGFEVHFASAAQKSSRSFQFSDEVENHQIVLNDSSFDGWIQELNPEIVVYDRFLIEEQFGWRVRKNCPNTLTILDTEDLHFLRKARQIAYKKQQEINIFTDDAKRELASIFRSDISLIISKYEYKLLKKLGVPKSKRFYLPFLSEKLKSSGIESLPGFDEREGFMFIGNFLHEPNVQTVSELKHKYWSLIRKQLPKAKLYIYGAYPTQKVLNWNNESQGFIVKGAVDSVDEVMQKHKVLLAPIPFGAGIKGKFFDAFKNSLPSVVTEVGAESMNKNNWAGFVAKKSEDFLESAKKLYLNVNVWNEKTKIGKTLFNNQFAKKELLNSFFDKIEVLQNNLEGYRNQCFIGEILHHQNFSATKFMSLWIEEKNKKKV